jgi:hypothetical protein
MSNIVKHFDDITYSAVISTISTLSIVYSLYATGAKRSAFIVGCLSMLISHPLSHIMAKNIANNQNKPIGIIGFLIFFLSQLIIVLIFVYSKNIEWGIRITTIFSILTTGFWIMHQHYSIIYTITSLGVIMLVTYFIYLIEKTLGSHHN